MEFATLEAMFPGRSRIAVGHGVQSWMRQAGAAVASPLTLLREYTNALRSLLAGDTVSVEGRYVQLSDVRLEFVPERRPAILIGGTGPKTLRLAGEIADGVLVDSSYSTRTVHTALAHVADGRAAGGAGPFSTVMFVVCAPGNDADERLAAEAVRLEVPPGIRSASAAPPGRSPRVWTRTSPPVWTTSPCSRWVACRTWPSSWRSRARCARSEGDCYHLLR